jgi:hypothetical protein
MLASFLRRASAGQQTLSVSERAPARQCRADGSAARRQEVIQRGEDDLILLDGVVEIG